MKQSKLPDTEKISSSQDQLDYIKHYHYHKIMIRFIRIFILIFFLVTWELLSDFKIIDSFFFSSPIKVVQLFCKMCANFKLYPLSRTFLKLEFPIVGHLSFA